ncbi:MAG: hypothetical protein KKB31_00865 [Nanoarchaeota archaeon]|nr:hypothetical protein [Nanoarchaeota archaeon]
MKKQVFICTLIIFLSAISSVSADQIDDGYNCLLRNVNSTGCAFTTEATAFSLLAVNHLDSCKQKLLTTKKSVGCWGPSSSCDIKTTAQAILALYKAGENITSSANWLFSQKKTSTDLLWFLQTESNSATQCTITPFGSSATTVNIGADKKITGSLGSCFSLYDGGYWLQIKEACYGKSFEVSCDTPFLTNLLYKEPGSTTIYVSEDTHNAGVSGRTNETINSLCFKNSAGNCDYEGGLWASMVLWVVNEKVNGIYKYDLEPFLPYLNAQSSNTQNKQYLPEVFLYSITGAEDFASALMNDASRIKFNTYIEAGDWSYSTALALSTFEPELPIASSFRTKATQWFLDTQERSGSNKGCWVNGDMLRNTAFILSSVWADRAPDAPEVVQPTPECISNATCINNLTHFGPNFFCNASQMCQQIIPNVQCVAHTVAGNVTCWSQLQNPWAFCNASNRCEIKAQQQRPECNHLVAGADLHCQNLYGSAYFVCNASDVCVNHPPQCTATTGCDFTIQDCEAGVCVPKPGGNCQNDTQCRVRYDARYICNSTNYCVIGPPRCGNGVADLTLNETCDGSTWGSITGCAGLLVYNAGNLSCFPPGHVDQCTFDTSQCYNSTTTECTDNATCVEAYNSSYECFLGACRIKPTQPPVCGNGVVDPGEDCEPGLANGRNCSYYTYDGGNISCYPVGNAKECKTDVSQCFFDDDDPCLTDIECVNLLNASFICDTRTGDCVRRTTTVNASCTDANYFCRSRAGCDLDSGLVITRFTCPSTYVCCNKQLVARDNTCSSVNGTICSSSQFCSNGRTVSATGLTGGQSCCVGGTCQTGSGSSSSGGTPTNCVYYQGGTCKSSCSSTEREINEACASGSGDKCCIPLGAACTDDLNCTSGKICENGRCIVKPSGSYFWLWFFLILIVLVVLAIVFREKLRPTFMKIQSMFGGLFNKSSKGPRGPPRPGMPPPRMLNPRGMPMRRILPSGSGSPDPRGPPQRGLPPRGPPRPGMPPRRPSGPQQRSNQKPEPKDKSSGELDDVLKKLKEMGK